VFVSFHKVTEKRAEMLRNGLCDPGEGQVADYWEEGNELRRSTHYSFLTTGAILRFWIRTLVSAVS